jgi:hypothetical protein
MKVYELQVILECHDATVLTFLKLPFDLTCGNSSLSMIEDAYMPQ